MANKNHFVLLGGAEHIDFFRENHHFVDHQWFWTVPKTAKKGDIGFVYLCAPVSRIVGQLEFMKEPFFNTVTFPQFKNNWMAEVGNVQYFETRQEITIKGLRKLFPDWKWLLYPRGKTKVPAEILQPLLELLRGDDAAKI
ncbi:MAG TPA: hypothetical protein PKY59_12215 [Pyrinomonadaceae bacterium]|nr:hypothetical protein [Pyrinomonadaceae bacterium]